MKKEKIINKAITPIYLILMASLLFFSCGEMTEKIDWTTENIPSKLIVDGRITNHIGKHPLYLSLTADYFNSAELNVVQGANIVISTKGADIVYEESKQTPGKYEAIEPFAGIAGNTYTLKINLESPIENIDYYEAEDKMIEGMRLDTIVAYLYPNFGFFESESDEDDEEVQDSMVIVAALYGLEPAHIENNYLIVLYKNGEQFTDQVLNDYYFNENDFDINGTEAFNMVYYENYSAGDTIGIELISITKEYEYFISGLNQISEPEDPFGFSGPPANAVGNVNNGQALGFFSCQYIQKAETIVLEED